MKHNVDISAILTHLVWKIFFSIPHITAIFSHRILFFFFSFWLTYYHGCHSWAGLGSWGPSIKEKKNPVGVFADYISTHTEISESTESCCPCEGFLTQKGRCLWLWRSLRRECPHSVSMLCWARARPPLGDAVEHLLGGALNYTLSSGESGDGQAGILRVLELYIPPGWYLS